MAKKNEAYAGELVQACRLLGDETRLKVVTLLARKEENVGNLCKILKLAQPTVSHHLGLLRMGRLIANRRNGKQVIYSLNTDVLSNVASQLGSLLRGKK